MSGGASWRFLMTINPQQREGIRHLFAFHYGKISKMHIKVHKRGPSLYKERRNFMSIKYWSQVGVGFLVFGFTALFSWYEGSALLDDPWEWKYSTPFSEMIHGSISTKEQIVNLDFFVYAAKFSPLFPSMMMMSASYLLVLLGYRFLRNRGFPLFLILFGVMYLLMSAFIVSSPTTGGNILFWLFVLMGLFLIILATLFHFSSSLGMKKQSKQA